MTKDEAKALWTKAQDNGRTLDACPRHRFDVDLDPSRTFGKRWRCSTCGGEADSQAKRWYELGLKHGAP